MSNYVSSDPADEETQRLIVELASRFRDVLAGEGRSVILAHLLDYLLKRSADPRAPKEIEIAMAVFGKSSQFDTSQDSTVRVHIHRLRQRLEHFNAGTDGMQLQIPKGEYRLVLVDESESSEQETIRQIGPHKMGSHAETDRKRTRTAITICVVATTALWTAIFLISGHRLSGASPLAQTSFWKPIATHERMPLIAAGDFYMVAERGPGGKIDRLSMTPTIRSGRDLDNYLRMHPDQYSTLMDRDIHRIPAKVATGAAAILQLVAAVRAGQDMTDIIPVSRISQKVVDSNNVIYIAHFSELGMLRSPILHLSNFIAGTGFNELKDIRSGKTFRARPASVAPSIDTATNDPYGYDYGYIASFPGPSGNQTIVISGIEDEALAQMVKLLSDKKQLDLLSSKTGGAKAFEALYQVRTNSGLIFDTNLLIARALESAKYGKTSSRGAAAR